MLGCTLTLERYSSAAPSEDSGSSAVQGCSIVVFGVTEDIDVEEELLPLLENKKKGGGPVEKTERLSQADDAVLITFVDQSRTKLFFIIITERRHKKLKKTHIAVCITYICIQTEQSSVLNRGNLGDNYRRSVAVRF